jgi:hypothetical protein
LRFWRCCCRPAPAPDANAATLSNNPPKHQPKKPKQLPRLLHAGRLRRPRNRKWARKKRPQHPPEKSGRRDALRPVLVGRGLRLCVRALRRGRDRRDRVFLRGRGSRYARDLGGPIACSGGGGVERHAAAVAGAGRGPPPAALVFLVDLCRRLRHGCLRLLGRAHPPRRLPRLHAGAVRPGPPAARALGLGRALVAQRRRVALPCVGLCGGHCGSHGGRAFWFGGGSAVRA